MGVWLNMLTIQQLRALNDDQVTARINERLAPQGGVGIQNLIQPADFLAAQFYVNELDRRENLRVNAERGKIETKRRRIDLLIEVLIVLLIGAEIPPLRMRIEATVTKAANKLRNAITKGVDLDCSISPTLRQRNVQCPRLNPRSGH